MDRYNPLNVHEVLKNGTKEEILAKLQYFNEINDNGDTVLHSILKNGKLTDANLTEILIPFLNKGVDPEIKNNCEQTVLHLAVERRLKNTVNLLLRFNTNIGIQDKDGNTIAHFFIQDEYEKGKLAALYPIMNTPENREITEKCSLDFLGFLIYKSIDFERKNHQGESAVHLAIKYLLSHIFPTLLLHTKEKNSEPMLEFLLDRIPTTPVLDLPDKNQISYYNSKYNHILNILLNKITTDSMVAEMKYGCSVISNAVKHKKKMNLIETYVKYFMDKFSDENLRMTVFHELMSTCVYWKDVDTDSFLTILRDLLAIGTKLDNQEDQKKLVFAAANASNLRPLQFLKEHGVELNYKSELGNNLLHFFARKWFESTSGLHSFVNDLLIRGDCQLNDLNNEGSTALQLAAGYGNLSMFRIFINLGADVNLSDYNKRTPLHEAVSKNVSQEIAELLIKNGANVNVKNLRGETPLYLAISNDNEPIARLLIENGAIVNCKDDRHQTPLHRAVQKIQTSESLCKLLLENGADVNAKDCEGNRPLHSICKLSNKDILWSNDFSKLKPTLKMLLEAGAYVNARNKRGQLALYLVSSSFEKKVIVDELLKYNADINDSQVRGTADDKFHVLLNHWMKLGAADLPLNEEYKGYISDCKRGSYYISCLEEVEVLKHYFFDGQKSLYDFVHMHPEQRSAYIHNENLKDLIESPVFEEHFPRYSTIILASYREAKIFETKKNVLIAIGKIFKVFNVSVPNVVEKIVNYLDGEDLYVMSLPF